MHIIRTESKPPATLDSSSAPASPRKGRTAQLKVGLLMEEVVGHSVHAEHVRRFLTAEPDLECRYVPIRYRKQDGLVERLALTAESVRAANRARREVMSGLNGWRADALLWNTQKPAMLCFDMLARTPSVISTDVTPVQYDSLGDMYGHQPDRPGIAALMKHLAVRGVFRLAAHVVPWTEWAARSLEADYRVGRDRMTVVPPGTDLTRFRPSVDKPSKADGRVRLLFVGGDFDRKGGRDLLHWFKAAPVADRCVLHLVTSAEIETHENVIVHRLDHGDEQLANLYSQADVFVFPTRAECFGIAVTEALAAGLPCVTCNVGGVGEIVQHDVNGLHVPPGDIQTLGRAIETLVEDEDRRRRYGLRGREIAEEHFDHLVNSRRLLDILKAVAK